MFFAAFICAAATVLFPCRYETRPKYVQDQPMFLNAVCEAHTALEPHELLDTVKNVERKLGRDQSVIRNGPRTVDLDVLGMCNSLIML
jgi:2-amino-4-hydroxy-6-hydroxymethyldihydropteridine diphosphokinase / dihydropteroate synthase